MGRMDGAAAHVKGRASMRVAPGRLVSGFRIHMTRQSRGSQMKSGARQNEAALVGAVKNAVVQVHIEAFPQARLKGRPRNMVPPRAPLTLQAVENTALESSVTCCGALRSLMQFSMLSILESVCADFSR